MVVLHDMSETVRCGIPLLPPNLFGSLSGRRRSCEPAKYHKAMPSHLSRDTQQLHQVDTTAVHTPYIRLFFPLGLLHLISSSPGIRDPRL